MAGFRGQSVPQPLDLFDFWIGDWEATWDGATPGRGRNTITRILDGKVLEENFVAATGAPGQPPLKGRSLSVYHPPTQTWRQTWVDNQGAFLVFTADTDGKRRLFQTAPRPSGPNTIVQRMVFHDIQRESFTWDWEQSRDGGKTWQRAWQIHYKRRA